MSLISRGRALLRAVFRARRDDAEVAREMGFHVDMEAAKLEREGVAPSDARRRALIAFGGVQQFTEAARDVRGFPGLQGIAMEVRRAFRSIRGRPGFAFVVAVTLATAIGTTFAVFGWANSLLFRAPPGVDRAGDLATIRFAESPLDGSNTTFISYPNFVDLRAGAKSLTGLAGHVLGAAQIGGSDRQPAQVFSMCVVGDYFGLLGVRPRLGRLLTEAESDPASGARVVVISEMLWKTAFASDSSAVGRDLMINGSRFVVIGVASRFRGTDVERAIDLWLPYSAYSLLRHNRYYEIPGRANGTLDLIARIKPGETALGAERELQSLMGTLVARFPDENENYKHYRPFVDAPMGLARPARVAVIGSFRVLLGMVAAVLVIALANVTNLVLLRGTRRRAEFAVRRALGASAFQVFRQNLIDGLMLAGLGVLLGLLVAFPMSKAVATVSFWGLPPMRELVVDARIVALAVLLWLSCGVMLGAIPTLMSRTGVSLSLKEAGRGFVGGGLKTRAALTVVQLAVASSLVVVALLLGRTIRNLNAVDLGFDPNGVTVFALSPESQGHKAEAIHRMRQQLLDDLGATSGISSVAVSAQSPFGMGYFVPDLRSDTHVGDDWPVEALSFYVSPTYFETLGQRLVSGRVFTRAEFDQAAPAGVMLSEAAARRLFGEQDAVGRRVVQRGYRTTTTYEVIGVVSDTRSHDLRGTDAGLYMYRATGEPFEQTILLLVSSRLPKADVERIVRSEVASIDPNLPLTMVETLSESVRRAMARERLFARLIGFLALVAGGLAAVGLYSVIAFGVAERTREIGVRMALGAHAPSIVGMIAAEGSKLVVIGLVFGLGAALLGARVVASLLFGVTTVDPASYVGAAVAALLVGLAASALPARAATRVDPVEALRSE